MKTELKKIDLQESDLELVVTQKTLGTLTTNALQIKSLIEQTLPSFSVENYGEDNIDKAKKDKATLNKAAKALNAKRIEIEKEFVKPFAEFKGIISETVSLISECSDKIDGVVKSFELKEKDEKRKEIEDYFDGLGFSLVSFEQVFESKWLNKSESIKDIRESVEYKITRIQSDLKTLEAINEDTDLLKSIYLDSLDLNHTIQYAKTLKANREKAAALAAPKAAPIEQPVKEVEALFEPKEEFLTRSFTVTTTKEKLIALSEFMNAQGINFTKI